VGQQLTTKSTSLTSFAKAMSKPCLARQIEFAQPRLIPLTLHSAGLRAFGERYVKMRRRPVRVVLEFGFW